VSQGRGKIRKGDQVNRTNLKELYKILFGPRENVFLMEKTKTNRNHFLMF
jgi:hypothetical protein